MPMKMYKRARRAPVTRKSGGFRKRAVIAAKRKSLVNLIKKVSLKQAETKTAFSINENNQLYHNTVSIRQDLLYTGQGITDANNGTSAFNNRLGDTVIGRGVSIKLWLANKKDRPNVMYRIVVFRFTSGDTVTANDIFYSGVANFMLKDYNTEKVKILYSKVVNLQVGASQTPTDGQNINYGKEAHKLIKIWIPLKNKKVVYESDNSGTPKWSDIGFCVVPYDSYGTLTTDNIASMSYHTKFYFKDP